MSKSNRSKSSRLNPVIVVACLALLGTLGAALLNNWDRLFGSVSSETTGNHALAVEIVSANYRRAFELNFTTRFAVRREYESVARSIAESHAAVQSRLVRFTDTGDKEAAATLHSMLQKLDQLDGLFKAMSPFIGDEIRLDGTGPPELTSLFHRAEDVRRDYVADLKRFADQTNVPLPSVPVRSP